MTPDDASLALIAAGLSPDDLAPLDLNDTVIFLNTYTDLDELDRWRSALVEPRSTPMAVDMDSPVDRKAMLAALTLVDLRQHEIETESERG
jgi:hypothetical protein